MAARLHSAALHLLRRVRGADRESGLTPARLSVLSELVYGGSTTLGELAGTEQVSAPTMSRLAAALEEAGLVRRRADASDGRVVRLEATDRGRRLLEETRDRRLRGLVELLRPLEPGELERLDEALAALEACLAGEGSGGGQTAR